MLHPPPLVARLGGPWWRQGQRRPAGRRRWPADGHLRARAGQAPQVLQHPTPGRASIGGGLREAPSRPTAPVGGAQQDDREESLHAQDVVAGVVLCLAALPCRLCRRGLGPDEPPCRAVRGHRGAAGAAAGPGATRAGAAARTSTTGAVAAAAPPRRWARAVSERAGAAPWARRTASRPGQRTCLPCWAVRCPIPHRRPWTTGRAEGCRAGRRKHRGSAGVGQGPF